MKEFVLKYDHVEYQGYFVHAENAKAVLAVIHGIGEHFGRYDRFAAYMAEQGYSVYGIDLPGHGKSPGVRGAIGPREEVYGLADAMIEYAMQEEPGLPVFLMGHSMGGNIVLSYRLARSEAPVKGYVISSPWIRLVEMPSAFKYYTGMIMAKIAPDMLMKNGISNDRLFTPSEEITAVQMPDKFCHAFITPRTAMDCFRWSKLVLANAAADRKPFFLMHGSNDGICAVEGSRELAAGAGTRCTYREWNGLKHEMLNEATWKDVANGMLAWLDSRL